MGQLIDGKTIAAAFRADVAREVADCRAQGFTPGLTVILVGDDPASHIYVRNKARACEAAGIVHQQITLPAATSETDLLTTITHLNNDAAVHGILVQLPLPDHISSHRVIEAIDPRKDADCFHPQNIGRVVLRQPAPRPCTPAGIMTLLEHCQVPLQGAHAVVIGRSQIVGRPIAQLLLAADATVTMCHRFTPDNQPHIAAADIVVVAVGKPHLIPGDWIKPGATVIDVGINRQPDGSIVGDVDTAAALERAQWITPVPGGVGPMTIAWLLKNTVTLAKRLQNDQ